MLKLILYIYTLISCMASLLFSLISNFSKESESFGLYLPVNICSKYSKKFLIISSIQILSFLRNLVCKTIISFL